MIKAEGTKSISGHYIELPMLRNMINKLLPPLQFATEDPDTVNSVFGILHNNATRDRNIQFIGTGIALLKRLRQGLAPDREGLVRDCIIPVIETGPLFNILVVTSFQPLASQPKAEHRGIDLYAMELNFFVDTIPTTIFRRCSNRNITLSSFKPEICIPLACKQQTSPILFITRAGSVPTGGVRAGGLQGSIYFAKA